MEKSRKEILKKAKEEAENILQESNARVERTIREIKEAQAEKDKTKAVRQELADFRKTLENMEKTKADERIALKMEKLKEKQNRKKEKKEKAKDSIAPQPVKKESLQIVTGDTVRIKGQREVGKVSEISKTNAVVIFGVMKMNVKPALLERAQEPVKNDISKKSSFVSVQTREQIDEKKLGFRQDIDVRGMRGDEALQAVTYFIDDAVLLGVKRVRILHGTGTGILRTLIRQYLQTAPGVKHFQDEHVQFGGAGITVVDLL